MNHIIKVMAWGLKGGLLKKLFIVHCLLYNVLVSAQTYPVQVTPQLLPPYGYRLSDYQTATTEKLFVNLLLTDAQESGRQVRLKMYVQGQGLDIRTNDFVAGAAPIVLDGGINLRLTILDLGPYFALNNLVGIAPHQYGRPLPEGRYDFCFEVYDSFSGQRISQKSCTSIFLMLNDPPLLNVPGRGDLVTMQDPQNILFNWTPRHINAPAVQYEFTLKELWDTGMDPQAAFLASPPLYQTTTFANTLLLGPADIQLLEGKTYGWQVKAFADNGLGATAGFRNSGQSEIYHFTYRADCSPPRYVISKALNSRAMEVTWQNGPHLRYRVQYRKKGYGDNNWFGLWTQNNKATIRDLEEDTEYEFRVGGECSPNGGLAYSAIHILTTPKEEEMAHYNCGIPPELEITNHDPLPSLGVNQVFTAGDFPVTVKSVTDHGGGRYSGWGLINITYLGDANVQVTFDNIKINTDHQMVAGMVVASYDADGNGIVDVDDTIDQIIQLLDNWAGTPEQIQELEGHKKTLDNELDNAINKTAQNAETVAELKEAKEDLNTSTDALINQGENPKGESVTAVKTATQQAMDRVREAEANTNIQSNGGSQISRDGYFDGVIDFIVVDDNIEERPKDGPELVNLSQMLPENDDEKYVRVTETTLSNNKQLLVSISNTANIGSDEDVAQIKQRIASVGNLDYMLWIHYDLKASQVKYKVAFGNNYYPDNLITQNQVVELMNDALSFDLRDTIGSSIVALSVGLDDLLETYHDQLPQIDTEIIAGTTAYDLLKFSLGFARECGESYGKQETGLVPRCLWDNENPYTLAAAYYAGFIDGAWEIAEMGYGIAEVSGAWNPLHPVFHTQTGMDIRQKTMDVLAMLKKLIDADDSLERIKTLVKNEVEKYIDETLSLDAQGRYNQGKLIFEVASAFFGIAEAKALLKTGKLTSNLLQGLASIPERIKVFIKKGVLKIEKSSGKIGVILDATKLGMDDATLLASKWIKPENGWYDVVVHGTPDNFMVNTDSKWVKITHRNLVKFLKSMGYSQNKPIRLISCNTGVFPDAIGKDLANKIGVEVKAPKGLITVFEDGSYLISNSGEWRIFKPGQ
ncbi:fibronectin type III domain-containing protein [Flagellimonas onchidii]|uniref:fibronectin type III domain-containing protein n=1 Tax=Flagellimonas onchidii TaxID=2562684 RepID=UPI001455FA7F|nr:fibronectin type III domain-containing protein [Allomuricauda onchidii]